MGGCPLSNREVKVHGLTLGVAMGMHMSVEAQVNT
jgi:hypothetical protein